MAVSRPAIKFANHLTAWNPEWRRVEHFGDGKDFLQVTVVATPLLKKKHLPITQITLDGHPLLAVAFQSQPSHAVEYMFVVREEGADAAAPPKDPLAAVHPRLPPPWELTFSGTWVPLHVVDKSGKVVRPAGKGLFKGGDPGKMILFLALGTGTEETTLSVPDNKPGSKPGGLILVFAVPSAARELQLTFGDAVVPVVVTPGSTASR